MAGVGEILAGQHGVCRARGVTDGSAAWRFEMVLLSKNPPAIEVFAWCERWLACLSDGDYAAAYGMIYADSQWQWTPTIIEELIANHGTLDPDPSGHRYRATPPGAATGLHPGQLTSLRVDPDDPALNLTGEVHPRFPFSVVWYRDPQGRSLGEVLIDYPLDGKWSHLSSTFDILPLEEGLALDLERIEVM